MPNYLAPGVYVEEVPPLARPIAGVGTSTPGFIGVIPDTIQLPAVARQGDPESDIARGYKYVDFALPESGSVQFIKGWSQYTKLFGDFVGDINASATSAPSPMVDSGQRNLAHAVYGFLNNGGGGCYVTRVDAETSLDLALRRFAAIDDISMVAAPGLTSSTAYAALEAHCSALQDRVAILDGVQTDGGTAFSTGDFTALQRPNTDPGAPPGLRPPNSSCATLYFPWIQEFDAAAGLIGLPSNGLIYAPPSGHLAGIYARTDSSRGVFKAPANEPVLGPTGLQYALTKADQDHLNPQGVNLIRSLNGSLLVWGARTLGGDANGDFRYISTRRYFNYLRESIQKGTQFVVFEPNTTGLWQRILRSVGDFLLNEWRAGGLFGDTPKNAFFVRCDEETNPPEVREGGQVVTEIGIAMVKPAEFVIFRIQQTTGG